MHCEKEDSEEPMELDNSNDRNKQNIQNEESKIPNNHNVLVKEAELLAEKLNDRLKCLSEEDAQVFMENFERNVLLLPKKKRDTHHNQHEQLSTQKSEESNQDYVMINSDDTKNIGDKQCTVSEEPERTLFGTSTKQVQKSYTTMIEAGPPDFNVEEQKVVSSNYGFQNENSSTKPPLGEDIKYHNVEKTYSFTSNRSISAERKHYPSREKHQEKLYSDAVKGIPNHYSTTFPATLSNENALNQLINYRRSYNSDRSNTYGFNSNNRPRSSSSHVSHRNKPFNEKYDKSVTQNPDEMRTDALQSKQSPAKPETVVSRPLNLQAISSQVGNVTQQQNDWLQKSSLQSSNRKSINILVLGQTGVGKSTWINAFANYLTYSTLEDAIAAEAPVCVIPTKFSMFDENYQRHDVLLGNHSNEVFSDKGQSATQNAKTYLFEKDDYDIYIIDTPGMDDTRGSNQDDENIQKILRAVSPFKELHAICFLFKANEARLTQSFKYCIGKLLGNLSKSALNNACFVFTNARGTFYKPGDTMSPLKAYFKELYEKERLSVTINDNNTFCLDNEAFRFICAYFSKIKFGDMETKTYSDSWKHSANEMIRLLDHASRLQAHNTSETLSINETRTWILQLVKPVVDVSAIIQTNMQQLEDRIRELESLENNIEELQKRAVPRLTTFETIPLEAPQTVCGSEKCITYENVSGTMGPRYKTVCHKNCGISGGDPSRFPDPALYECEAFNYKHKCRKCGCHLEDHTRIFYAYRTVTNHLEVEAQQSSINSHQDAAKFKRRLIRHSEKFIDKYLQEFNFLMTAMAYFSTFLAQNGICQKSDIFEKHIQRLVETEERMIKHVRNCDERKYYKLVELLMSYRDIRDRMYHQNSKNQISLPEIQDIRQKLFSMPLTGSKIAEVFDIHVKADKHDHAHDITRYDKKSFLTNPIGWIKHQFSSILGQQKP